VIDKIDDLRRGLRQRLKMETARVMRVGVGARQASGFSSAVPADRDRRLTDAYERVRVASGRGQVAARRRRVVDFVNRGAAFDDL